MSSTELCSSCGGTPVAQYISACLSEAQGKVKLGDHASVEQTLQKVNMVIAAAGGTDGKYSVWVEDLYGLMFTQRGAYEQAIAHFERAEECATDRAILANIKIHHGAANLLSGRVNDAITLYEEAVCTAEEVNGIDALSQALSNLGGAYIMSGDIASAIKSYGRGLELAKASVPRVAAFISLVWLHTNYGPAQKAQEYADKLKLEMNNIDDVYNSTVAYAQLAAAYIKLGHINEAITMLQCGYVSGYEKGSNVSVLAEIATLAASSLSLPAWMNAAIPRYEQLIEIGQTRRLEECIPLISYYLQRGLTAEAGNLLQRISTLDDYAIHNPHYMTALAQLKSAQGNFVTAEELYLMALSSSSQSAGQPAD